jgi:subtilisin
VGSGVTFAVAAGNDATDVANQVPAAFPEVITVSALADFNGLPGGGAASTCRSDQDDTLADFSNYGAGVDLIAPGVCIHSTWNDGGYGTISGTSMASPHVAGAAALYRADFPGTTPAQVESALKSGGNLGWSTSGDPDGQRRSPHRCDQRQGRQLLQLPDLPVGKSLLQHGDRHVLTVTASEAG